VQGDVDILSWLFQYEEHSVVVVVVVVVAAAAGVVVAGDMALDSGVCIAADSVVCTVADSVVCTVADSTMCTVADLGVCTVAAGLKIHTVAAAGSEADIADSAADLGDDTDVEPRTSIDVGSAYGSGTG
jgi:hypothetical protein